MEISSDFIQKRSVKIPLSSGEIVSIRPVVPEDRGHIEEGMSCLSRNTRYFRFLQPVEKLSSNELVYFTELDYVNHFAWCASIVDGENETGVGIARYVRLPDLDNTAEFAIVIIDTYQRRGLGKILLFMLSLSAKGNGISRFKGYVQPENGGMLKLMRHAGAEQRNTGGMCEVFFPLPLAEDLIENETLREKLKSTASGKGVGLASM
jgi:RimJ/RimL family protein N-acetyltransferase